MHPAATVHGEKPAARNLAEPDCNMSGMHRAHSLRGSVPCWPGSERECKGLHVSSVTFGQKQAWHAVGLTWRVDDGEVWTVLVLDFHDDLLRPELLLALQARVLVLDVLLQPVERGLAHRTLAKPVRQSMAGVAVCLWDGTSDQQELLRTPRRPSSLHAAGWRRWQSARALLDRCHEAERDVLQPAQRPSCWPWAGPGRPPRGAPAAPPALPPAFHPRALGDRAGPQGAPAAPPA